MSDKITIDRSVLQQAAIALQKSQEYVEASKRNTTGWGAQIDRAADAIKNLREAPAAGDASRKEGDCVDCGGDCPQFCCAVYMSGFGSHKKGNPYHPAAQPLDKPRGPLDTDYGWKRKCDDFRPTGHNAGNKRCEASD